MLKAEEYELVCATESDRDLLFKWANDRTVRLNSFNSDLINYQDHLKWFMNKIKSNDSIIYMFKVNKKNAGVIRLDRIEANTCLINYSISKEYRRKGYATILLILIKEKYKSSLLIGKVKKDNIGSIKAFMRAGYIMKEELDVFVFYSFIKE